MEKKISQLTAKGANLSATDLLEISEVITDGYASKYVTGAEVIAAAQTGMQEELISGTNIKTVNSTSLLGSGDIVLQTNPSTISSVNGGDITGLTNAVSASVLIPANTILTTNTIYIKAFIDRTVVSGSGSTLFRFYTNTNNSLTGATFLGSGASMATSVRFQRFERNIYVDASNLNCFLTSTSSATDYTSSAISLIPFNKTVDNYLIFTVQHSTSTTDVAAWKKVIVQKYD